MCASGATGFVTLASKVTVTQTVNVLVTVCTTVQEAEYEKDSIRASPALDSSNRGGSWFFYSRYIICLNTAHTVYTCNPFILDTYHKTLYSLHL